MSSEEENPTKGKAGPVADKPPVKRAKKKTARKVAKKVAKPEKPNLPSEDPHAVAGKSNHPTEQAAQGQPKSEGTDASPSESKESPTHRNGRGQGGDNNHQNRNQDRGGRNNRFKKKNKKPKGGRWQNKQKRQREEESPIELGDLQDAEILETFESITNLSESFTTTSDSVLDFVEIYNLALPELRAKCESDSVDAGHAPNREQLLNALLSKAGEAKGLIETVGILELLEDDSGGIIVYERDSYRIKALSAFVPQALIERYGLQRGHIIKAQLHPKREEESCPFAIRIIEVMGRDPETLTEIVPFTERIPYYPLDRILMEAGSESKWDNLSMRVVDCLTPIGFGQRGLIVAPPRTGKTVLMQGMANSIQKNYPDAHLIILLIDERPEEVTDFRRQVSGEVISSTFDESAESHVHAAEMVIEKARRMVEVGKDVVILLDSITRLARAYNTTMPSSGKILSGGVEANALQKPKRFFGSARNIEDGGSLTIIATALVETGSKMDEVIFEEFKGTGNMELHLDRGLSDKRIFPALSMDKSGTRKEELLYHPDEMLKIYSLRRAMKGLPSIDAMEMLIQRIKKTKTNAEFLMSVSN